MWNAHPTIYKWDKIWLGIIIGLLCPLLGFPLVYLLGVIQSLLIGDNIVPLGQYLDSLKQLNYVSKYLSVGCLINLGAFYLLLNKNYINAARGVIAATMLFAIPVVINIFKSL